MNSRIFRLARVSRLTYIPVRHNKAGNVANLYDILMINPNATSNEIEHSFRSKAKFYDPDITGDRSNAQVFEELKLADQTLIDEDRRDEYDVYLASLGSNRTREEDTIDPEELERRRRERGKKRFEEDHDFVNEEFFNMWKQRTKTGSGQNA